MPIHVATVAETQSLEAAVIDGWGFPQALLMERAALALATLTRRVTAPDRPIVVLAGSGNNGADGLAAARLLAAAGRKPEVLLVTEPRSPATSQQATWLQRWGVTPRPWSPTERLSERTVVLDAMFGFGLNRAPEGTSREAIATLNDSGATVIAMDLPSGLDGTTGTAPGEVVRADWTVAAGLVKVGTVTDPALASVGRLVLGDIGFPAELLGGLPGTLLSCDPLPARSPSAHKGQAGTLLVVGGSDHMSGAPALVARAAGRIGAGVVVVTVPERIRSVVAGLMPEALVLPLPETPDGAIRDEAWETLQPWLGRATAGVVGPGLGRDPLSLALATRLYREWDRPLVLDADALQPEILGVPVAGDRLLTPHPGEAGRLLDWPVQRVQADRLSAARTLAERSGAIAVLKGARTIVTTPAGRYGIHVGGHPAMATAGFMKLRCGLVMPGSSW